MAASEWPLTARPAIDSKAYALRHGRAGDGLDRRVSEDRSRWRAAFEPSLQPVSWVVRRTAGWLRQLSFHCVPPAKKERFILEEL